MNYLSEQFAVRENAREYLSYAHSILLPDPDPILRNRGEESSILSALLADEQVTSTMLARKYRVLNKRDYHYTAGQARGEEISTKAFDVCEKLTKDLEQLEMFDLISQILDTPFYGMVPLEIEWEFKNNWWHVKEISGKPQHWFGFDTSNKLIFKDKEYKNKEIPFGKIILSRHFPTYENPYGLRLLARVLWAVSFKRGGITFYTKFMEKYGSPWAIGSASPKASREDKANMAKDLARMVQDCVAVIPSDAQVQLLTPNTGGGELHESFLKRWDASISKVLMGQTLTMELDSDNGSRAASLTHLEVANDIATADCVLVENVMNEIAWVYTQINVGNDVLAPEFAYPKTENYSLKADLDLKLAQLGVEFTKEYFERNYQLNMNEFSLVQQSLDKTKRENYGQSLD